MKQKNIPKTQGVRFLTQHKVDFIPHEYKYVDHGGTKTAADSLGVDEHAMIKTLVFEMIDGKNKRRPLIVLMHGDKSVSTKQLARFLDVKTIEPATEQGVTKYTGYMPGGTSPFGTRQEIPVYVESAILTLPKIYINGGKRGFLVEIDPAVLTSVLPITEVEVSI